VRQGQLPGGGALRVAPFVNRSPQAEAGGLFGGAVRQQLAARGRLAAEGDAEAPLLDGELVGLRSSPSALGAVGPQAFRLDADLHVRVRRGEAVLYDDLLHGYEDYLPGVDVIGTEANRRAALRRLCETMSRDALERLEAAAAFAGQ
jgi:hypothetical protein